MRKISDTHYTDISPDEQLVADLVDYLCEQNGMDLEASLHRLVMLPQVVTEVLKDDTFRTYLEDEYPPPDSMVQQFSENEPACTGYPEEVNANGPASTA